MPWYFCLVAALLSALAVATPDGVYYVKPAGCPKEGYLVTKPCGTLASVSVVRNVTNFTNPGLQWRVKMLAGGSSRIMISSVLRAPCAANALSGYDPCYSNSVGLASTSSSLTTWRLIRSRVEDVFYIQLEGRKGCIYEYLSATCDGSSGKVQLFSRYDPTVTKATAWVLEAVGSPRPEACPTPSPSDFNISTSGEVMRKDLLFVQNFASVTISGNRTSVVGEEQPSRFAFILSFQDPSTVTAWFHERPYRQAGYMQTTSFVQQFPLAFGVDNPNAALVGTTANGTRATVMIELCCPRWINSTNLEYGAVLLSVPISSMQAGYRRASKHIITRAVPALLLSDVSLFIDSAGTSGLASFGNVASDVLAVAQVAFSSGPIGMAIGLASAISTELFDDQITSDLNEIINLLTNGLSILEEATSMIENMVSAGLQMQLLYNAQTSLSGYLQDSRGQSDLMFGVGSNTPCPIQNDPITGWAWEFVSNAGGGVSLVSILQDFTNSLPSWNSSMGNLSVPLPPNGYIGVVQYLFNQYFGCDETYCNPSDPPTSGMSPQYYAMIVLYNLIGTANQGLLLCNEIVAGNNMTDCSFMYAGNATYCSEILGVQDLLTNMFMTIRQLAYPGPNMPWSYLMWRDYNMGSDWFFVANNGLVDDKQDPFYDWPDVAKMGYGWSQDAGYYYEDPLTTPPLWVNMNNPVLAGAGRVITGLNFYPTTCQWCGYRQGNNYGFGNILNVAIQSCALSVNSSSGGWTFSDCSSGDWTAASVPSQKTPPANVYQGMATEGCVPTPKYNIYDTDSSYTPYQPNASQSCAVNPQYISLVPVLMPPNYITVGAGLTMWICDNYPGTSDGLYGPNAVLGLQLVGLKVNINSEDGTISYGDTIVVDNRGYCKASIFTAAEAGTGPGEAGWNELDTPGSYYPPFFTFPENHYDVLQVFDLVSDELGGYLVENSAFWAADSQLTAPSPPAFITGASFWLKNNRASIGLITSANPYFVYDPNFSFTIMLASDPNQAGPSYKLASCMDLYNNQQSPVVQQFLANGLWPYYNMGSCGMYGGYVSYDGESASLSITCGGSDDPVGLYGCYVLWSANV